MKIRLKYIGLGNTHLPEYMELPEGTSIEELVHLIREQIQVPLDYLFTRKAGYKLFFLCSFQQKQ